MKEKNNVKYSDNDEDGYDRNAEQDDEEGFGEHNEDNDYNNKNDNSNNVENDENEEDEDYIKKKSSKKKKVSDFYYNYQIRDKKKQSNYLFNCYSFIYLFIYFLIYKNILRLKIINPLLYQYFSV